MKGLIGNLLLVAGTVLGGIGGANAQRASRIRAVEDLPPAGEVLFGDLTSATGEVLVAAGTEIDSAVLAILTAEGIERVAVRVPPRDTETVVAADTSATIGRSIASELPVSEDVTIPANKFIDEKVAAQIIESGVETVDVNVVRAFSFAEWEGKTMFFAGIAAMVLGILVKRTRGAGAGLDGEAARMAGPEQLRERLQLMTTQVVGIAGRVGGMSADDIHEELTPLFSDYGQPFVEDRHVLTGAYGAGRYANIMGPFSSAERRLNRAWSAAVDGALEESRLQVGAAVPYLEEALAAFPNA